MDKGLYMRYMIHTELLSGDESEVLRGVVERYPYCHTAHMLLLKAMHNADDFSYPSQLSHSALKVADRTALFELINRIDVQNVAYQGSEPQVEPQKEDAKDLSQWVEDQRGGRKSDDNISTDELIDRFIQTAPRIKPAEEAVEVPEAETYDVPQQAIMTETLARIYLSQKKYDHAIEAYSILMLKNPKKSSFFALRIEEIKELKKKTKI